VRVARREKDMDNSVTVLLWVAAGSVAGLVAFALYRWRQRRRVRRVERWVGEYLSARYGELPSPLHVNCSDDRLWPVLVDFSNVATGMRHRMRFDCPGSGDSLSLLAEEWKMCEAESPRVSQPARTDIISASPLRSPVPGGLPANSFLSPDTCGSGRISGRDPELPIFSSPRGREGPR
jgi:hypothetical protein